MAGTDQPRRRRRWALWLGLGIVAFIAAVAFAATRPPVSNWLLASVLEGRGLVPARVEGARLGLSGASVASIEGGAGPDLVIDDLQVSYGFPAILSGKVKSVRARTLTLSGAYREGGVDLPVIGRIGGGEEPKTQRRLDLPVAQIDELAATLTGLPAPFGLSGKLSLMPEVAQEGAYRLGFEGRIGFGLPMQGTIGLVFDGAGDLTLDAALDAVALSSPPVGDTYIRIEQLGAHAAIANGGISALTADVAVSEGKTTVADFGNGRLSLDLGAENSGTLAFDLVGIVLAEAHAAALAASVENALSAWRDKPPVSAFAADIDRFAGVARGTAEISGKFAVSAQGEGGLAERSWVLDGESLSATIAPRGGSEPVTIAARTTADGPLRLSARAGASPAFALRAGLSVAGLGPDLDIATLALTSAPGVNGDALAHIASLDLSGVRFAWASRDLTIGLTAGRVRLEPAVRDAIALDKAVLSANGLVLRGLSAQALAADLSGIAVKEANRWTYVPDDNCLHFRFANLDMGEVEIADGGVRACSEGNVALALLDFDAPNVIAMAGRYELDAAALRYRAGGTRLDLSGTFPSGAFSGTVAKGGSPVHLQAAFSGGPLTLDLGGPDTRVRIATLSADGTIDSAGGKAVLSWPNLRAQIVDAHEPVRFAPLDVSSDFGIGDGHVRGAFDVTALGRPLVSALMDHDLDAGAGALTFDTGKITFRRGQTEIQKLLPVLRGWVTGAEGKIGAKGELAWRSGEESRSRGTLVFDTFGVTTKLGRIEGIDGTIALDRLFAPRTPLPQMLRVRTMNVGLPLADGEIAFNLPEEFRLEIIRAVWPWAGGHLAIVDGAFVPGEPVQHLAMTAEQIDLTEIFRLLSIDGLEGTGIVTGRLPIEVRDGNAFIVDGKLAAEGEGVLKYNGDAAAAAAANGEGASLLFTALQNFNYRSLEIGVNGRMTGVIVVTLKLLGFNPALYDGYPFELNISIESELANLILQTTQGIRIPGQIEDALPRGE